MKKTGYNFLWIVLLIGSFIGTIVFLYYKSKPKPEAYDTVSPFITDIAKKTVATGSIVPRKEVFIKPKVSGIISKIFAEPGQIVKKGDIIAQVEIIPDMVTMNSAESRLNQARISYDDAKKEYERNKTLAEKGIIPEVEFRQYNVSWQSAKEELSAAQANLELIKEGISRKSGKKGTNTIVRSNLSGMVLDVPVKEGNSVIESNTFNEGTTIASVADMNEMIFEGVVDESEVGKLKVGMPLVLTIGAIGDRKFDAELEYISPKGIEENGAINFQIRAKVKLQENAFIRAGYSANADIILEQKESVLALDEGVLIFEKDKIFVEIEKTPGVFEKKAINTGLSDGLNIEVLSGIDIKAKIKKKKDE